MTLDELTGSLIESLQKQDWPRALVLAWHGFSQDRIQAVEWSQQSWGYSEQESQSFTAWLEDSQVTSAALNARLLPRPCLILLALDQLALRGHFGRRKLFAQPQRFATEGGQYWLTQRATPYRATGQNADLNKFLPNWSVIAEAFDSHNPSRKTELFESRQLDSSFFDPPASLIVYLVEFDNDPVFDPPFCRDWCAQAISNETALIAEALQHLEQASQAGAHVVVFPELCVPNAVQLAIQSYLRSRQHPHRLIIAGSFHVREGGQWFNQALALDDVGCEIAEWRHRKMTAVSVGQGKISEGNKRAPALRVAATPCGLQAIAICLDLAQALPWEQVPFKELALAWLWVPSLSENTHAHRDHAKACRVAQAMVTACANQRLPNSGQVGESFVVAPQTTPVRSISGAQIHRIDWR